MAYHMAQCLGSKLLERVKKLLLDVTLWKMQQVTGLYNGCSLLQICRLPRNRVSRPPRNLEIWDQCTGAMKAGRVLKKIVSISEAWALSCIFRPGLQAPQIVRQ